MAESVEISGAVCALASSLALKEEKACRTGHLCTAPYLFVCDNGDVGWQSEDGTGMLQRPGFQSRPMAGSDQVRFFVIVVGTFEPP